MKTLKYISLLIFIMISIGIHSQRKSNLQYSIGIPMGDTKDYIGNTSWRGLLFEYEHMMKPNFGVGIQFGWNTFYEEMPRATYQLDNGALTSKQYRYLNNIPILLTGCYYFKDATASIRPFVGFGLGTSNMEERTDNGLYTTKNKSWTFAISPKAGILIPFNYKTSVCISLDYNTTLKTSDISQHNWLGINVGFSCDK